jgi:hypothetical protein
MYVPLILTAYLEIAATGKRLIEQNSGLPFVSYFKDTLDKGVSMKQ